VVTEIESYELQSQMESGSDFILIDIRSEGEVARGVLPGAQHLPMHLIPMKLAELPKDKDIVLYCHSGARSYHACAYLKQQGYDNVINLRGGILAWARNGYDIASRIAV